MNFVNTGRRALYQKPTNEIKALLSKHGLIVCKAANGDYCYLVELGHFKPNTDMPKGDLLIYNNDVFYPHIERHKKVLLVHGRRGKEKEDIGCFVWPESMSRKKLLEITKG